MISRSVIFSPRRPAVSRQVCSPSSLQRRKIRAMNGRCTIGSPPDRVIPPLLIFSTLAYLPIVVIARDTRHRMAVALVPGVGVVAVLAAQQAAGEEGDEAQARAVDRAADLVGVDVADEVVLLGDVLDVGGVDGVVVGLDLAFLDAGAVELQLVAAAGARRGHAPAPPSHRHGALGHALAPSEPWKVRLMTSICCSLLSLTKFTA